MDVLQFISALIGHLVWPVTILILACKFRVPIVKLLYRLRRLTGKGWEFEFDKELVQLTKEAQKAQLPPPLPLGRPVPGVPAPQHELEEQRDREVAELSPPAAIALAWARVERNLAEAVSRASGQPPSDSAIENARRLSDTGRIKKEFVGFVEKMQALRNRVMQGEHPDVSLSNANIYASLARRVIAAVRTADS
jgi:hypothetical protein